MTDSVLVDAGPLVAYFDSGDDAHDWTVATFDDAPMPLLTCEAVLVEAAYLLRFSPPSQDVLLEWLGDGTLSIAFDLASDSAAVRRLMKKYRNVPMSLADACLVRMSETFDRHRVCTLDGDFHVYRKDGGAVIPLITPESR